MKLYRGLTTALTAVAMAASPLVMANTLAADASATTVTPEVSEQQPFAGEQQPAVAGIDGK